MEIPTVCCEYVLFPLVNTKKTALGLWQHRIDRTRWEFEADIEEKRRQRVREMTCSH